jgi:hypothetical protein
LAAGALPAAFGAPFAAVFGLAFAGVFLVGFLVAMVSVEKAYPGGASSAAWTNLLRDRVTGHGYRPQGVGSGQAC